MATDLFAESRRELRVGAALEPCDQAIPHRPLVDTQKHSGRKESLRNRPAECDSEERRFIGPRGKLHR